MLASNPLAIERPAGSSAPLLMRDPEDNCSSVVFRALLVRVSSFSAESDGMLFRIPRGIVISFLESWSRLLGTPPQPCISEEFLFHVCARNPNVCCVHRRKAFEL